MGVQQSRIARRNRVSSSSSLQDRRNWPYVHFAFLLVGVTLVTIGYTTGVGGNSMIISGFFLISIGIVSLAFRYFKLRKPVHHNPVEMRTGQPDGVAVYSVSADVEQPSLPTPDNPPPYSAISTVAPPSYYEVTKEGNGYGINIEDNKP